MQSHRKICFRGLRKHPRAPRYDDRCTLTGEERDEPGMLSPLPLSRCTQGRGTPCPFGAGDPCGLAFKTLPFSLSNELLPKETACVPRHCPGRAPVWRQQGCVEGDQGAGTCLSPSVDTCHCSSTWRRGPFPRLLSLRGES